MKTSLRELRPDYYAIEYDGFMGWEKIAAVLYKQDGCDVFSMTPVLFENNTLDHSLIQLWVMIGENGHHAEDEIRQNIMDDIRMYAESGDTGIFCRTYIGTGGTSRVIIKYIPGRRDEEGRLEKPWLWVSYYFM